MSEQRKDFVKIGQKYIVVNLLLRKFITYICFEIESSKNFFLQDFLSLLMMVRGSKRNGDVSCIRWIRPGQGPLF